MQRSVEKIPKNKREVCIVEKYRTTKIKSGKTQETNY